MSHLHLFWTHRINIHAIFSLHTVKTSILTMTQILKTYHLPYLTFYDIAWIFILISCLAAVMLWLLCNWDESLCLLLLNLFKSDDVWPHYHVTHLTDVWTSTLSILKTKLILSFSFHMAVVVNQIVNQQKICCLSGVELSASCWINQLCPVQYAVCSSTNWTLGSSVLWSGPESDVKAQITICFHHL